MKKNEVETGVVEISPKTGGPIEYINIYNEEDLRERGEHFSIQKEGDLIRVTGYRNGMAGYGSFYFEMDKQDGVLLRDWLSKILNEGSNDVKDL